MMQVIEIEAQWLDDTADGFVAFTDAAPDLIGVGETREDAEDDMLYQYNTIVWH